MNIRSMLASTLEAGTGSKAEMSEAFLIRGWELCLRSSLVCRLPELNEEWCWGCWIPSYLPAASTPYAFSTELCCFLTAAKFCGLLTLTSGYYSSPVSEWWNREESTSISLAPLSRYLFNSCILLRSNLSFSFWLADGVLYFVYPIGLFDWVFVVESFFFSIDFCCDLKSSWSLLAFGCSATSPFASDSFWGVWCCMV